MSRGWVATTTVLVAVTASGQVRGVLEVPTAPRRVAGFRRWATTAGLAVHHRRMPLRDVPAHLRCA